MIIYNTAYTIFKNNIQIGHLIGSLHFGMSPIDYKKIQDKFEPLLKDCKEVYFEAKLPHYSSLTAGVEKALLSHLNEIDNGIKINYFESTSFQYAMLNSRVWFGEKIINLPWKKYSLLKKYPVLINVISKIVARFFKVYNVVYNFTHYDSHTQAVQAEALREQSRFLELYQNYMKNISTSFTADEQQAYLMKDRDQDFANIILSHQHSGYIYMVGTAHIPNIVKILEHHGLTLKPWDLM